MTTYVNGLTKTNYIPNIIILFAGQYFSIRQPDSGLVVDSRYNGLIQRISINPTSIDPLRASTTINSTSFTLIDGAHEVSKLFTNQKGFRTGSLVRIWLGRSFEDMDFSDYLELPQTTLNKVQKVDNAYNFSTIEKKDRLNNGSFNARTKLAVNILDTTTTITLQSVPALFQAPGYAKIDDEYISFSGISGNNLTGCTRGDFNSIPADHEAGEDVILIYDIAPTNGIDLIAQLLISNGGGGPYDVLPEGAGFSSTLVDTAQLEAVRDEFFTNRNLSFRLGGIENVQKFLEDEVFSPMGVRLRTNANGKIGLAVLDRNIFEIDAPVINNDNTIKSPGFNVSDDKIINRVRVFYNWSDGKGIFEDFYELTDTDSINDFGEKPWTELKYKGVKSLTFAQSIANLFLARFAYPRPEITVETLNSTSYLQVGDKVEFSSDRIPGEADDLTFNSTLEAVKKSYNPTTGIVSYQLSYTSFSGVKQCFISPSDTITSVTNQKTVGIAAGRGVHYRAGWRMRLFDKNAGDYASTQVNEIQSIVGDTITFVDNWGVTLSPNNYRILFADYDNVTEQQKKFCFISDGTNNFPDSKPPYQVTFS